MANVICPGVINGDCGSLIVDQETLEVYGHVIASNPLGEAYVVPLQNIFRQISHALGAKDLSLPKPRMLMENLVHYYSKWSHLAVTAEESQIVWLCMLKIKELLTSMKELDSTLGVLDAIGNNLDELTPVSYQQVHRPADQNPPCNTLYVGNLPIDASEDELKAVFTKQTGYKRLTFRTKQNIPMCFVEFENVLYATKALNELHGHSLRNSSKNGLQLSFSKNPLGVRPSGTATTPGPMASPFSIASGPPPPLAAADASSVLRTASNLVLGALDLHPELVDELISYHVELSKARRVVDLVHDQEALQTSGAVAGIRMLESHGNSLKDVLISQIKGEGTATTSDRRVIYLLYLLTQHLIVEQDLQKIMEIIRVAKNGLIQHIQRASVGLAKDDKGILIDPKVVKSTDEAVKKIPGDELGLDIALFLAVLDRKPDGESL